MDQHPDEQAHAEDRVTPPAASARPAVDYEPTGVASVDRVLAEVTAVVDAPVADHVEVFERAHDQLRRALDARPGTDGEQDT
ncbi:hypothetical protein [Nocardioides hwasunensis]|uniref:Uncharacterized protein n=1 Tax=Nocardioides hwasunensis TaxID=397258 RepID=A0ABR8MQD0_9ACTN|nr:hypothetical protein [Nocardioides hwasunensis]MBD3917092.1 hypothetical protein [Nocardioides hwasunensis]